MPGKQIGYGNGVFVGGSWVGSGTGVSVGGSTTVAVPVIGTMITAVLVGFGVRVEVGGIMIRGGSSRFVGVLEGMKGVRVKVGVDVGDEV